MTTMQVRVISPVGATLSVGEVKEMTTVEIAKWLADARKLFNVKPDTYEVDGMTVFLFKNPRSEVIRVEVTGVSAEGLRSAYRLGVRPSRTAATAPDELEKCGRCNGSGVYYGAGYVENGVFKGYSGVCFRCKGAKKVTHAVNEAGERGQAEYAARQMGYDVDLTAAICKACPATLTIDERDYCELCSDEFFAEWLAGVEADQDPAALLLDDGTYTMVYGDGAYFTFRVRTPKTGKFEGRRMVEYLSGPDNSLDFQAFGFVNEHSINVWKRFERGHMVNRAREIEAMARDNTAALEAAGLLYAERSSRCRRCNKVLTVPASLAAGYGPDCAAIVGIEYGATSAGRKTRSTGNKCRCEEGYTCDACAQTWTGADVEPNEFSKLTDNELETIVDRMEKESGRGLDAFENSTQNRSLEKRIDRAIAELNRRARARRAA